MAKSLQLFPGCILMWEASPAAFQVLMSTLNGYTTKHFLASWAWYSKLVWMGPLISLTFTPWQELDQQQSQDAARTKMLLTSYMKNASVTVTTSLNWSLCRFWMVCPGKTPIFSSSMDQFKLMLMKNLDVHKQRRKVGQKLQKILGSLAPLWNLLIQISPWKMTIFHHYETISQIKDELLWAI